jgi:hypothetical protein
MLVGRYATAMVRAEMASANHRTRETGTQVQENRFIASDSLLLSAFLICKKKQGVGDRYVGLLHTVWDCAYTHRGENFYE